FTPELSKRLLEILRDYEVDFNEMTKKFFKLPSALSRMEKTGVVKYEQALEIGTVGNSAKMSGLMRDVRISHPFNLYKTTLLHTPIIKHHGDVYSRVQLRREEIWQSIGYLRTLLQSIPDSSVPANWQLVPEPGKFIISLVEG